MVINDKRPRLPMPVCSTVDKKFPEIILCNILNGFYISKSTVKAYDSLVSLNCFGRVSAHVM